MSQLEESPEQLQVWKKVVFGVAAVGLAVAILVYSFYPAKTYSQTQCYFSTDDGKTWFVDSNANLPPYVHDGHEAVRAVVYSFSGGSKTFCGYLVRFPEDAKKKIMKLASQTTAEGKTMTVYSVAYESENNGLAEVKRPLKNEPWVSINSTEGNAVMRVHSPDGSELDSVMP